ncbi:Uncharacterised protein [Serratia fonticola]|uniref:Uncharacterized protein n=1 Tax=Serratia fonticola TaxID=47917 RepID=A0A4U9TG75_SERFO|nr:Uncharacterised protein [Serratia fonticola]
MMKIKRYAKALEDNDCGHQRLPADALDILRGATKNRCHQLRN